MVPHCCYMQGWAVARTSIPATCVTVYCMNCTATCTATDLNGTVLSALYRRLYRSTRCWRSGTVWRSTRWRCTRARWWGCPRSSVQPCMTSTSPRPPSFLALARYGMYGCFGWFTYLRSTLGFCYLTTQITGLTVPLSHLHLSLTHWYHSHISHISLWYHTFHSGTTHITRITHITQFTSHHSYHVTGT